jgi:hypothetical protein
MMNTLLVVNTVLFGAAFVVWRRGDFLNAFIKIVLFGAFVTNLVYLVKGA